MTVQNWESLEEEELHNFWYKLHYSHIIRVRARYRLKIVENDGKATYSPTRSVNLALSKKTDFIIYPNPTKNILNIKFNTPISQTVDFELVNTLGQIVYSYRLEAKEGENNTAFITSSFIKSLLIGKKGIRYMLWHIGLDM